MLSLLSVICVSIESSSNCGSYGPCSAPDVKESSADQGLRAQGEVRLTWGLHWILLRSSWVFYYKRI